MLGRSINLFRIRGIPLTLHVSFLLLLAYVAWSGWIDDGWEGAAWSVAILGAFFSCVVLHELGHSFTAMHFGIGVRRILLMPIGGMAEFESIPRAPRRELLITIAGPAVNFLIASILWFFFGAPSHWSLSNYEANTIGFAYLLLHWNLLMGCFNLAPVFPMDGGRILRAVLATRLTYLRATFWAASIGKVLAIGGAFIAIFWFQAYLTGGLFLFIFYVGGMEYRAIRQRELVEAKWHETRLLLSSNLTPEASVIAPEQS